MAHLGKGHSEACCSIPAVSADYSAKGTYIDAKGFKTYKTGPSDAENGILIVYDIFGFSSQALQGADILANSDESKKYQVFIPDFLKGQYASSEWFPPDNEEKQGKMGAFFGGPANPQSTIPNVAPLAEELNKLSGGKIKRWGIIGFCWGGKIITLTLSSSNIFGAAASAHPAMVDGKDAEAVKVPYIMLPSGEEDAQAVKDFESKLTVSHQVETFQDQVHGWMGARGDLKDSKVSKEYQRGYQLILEFFHKHL